MTRAEQLGAQLKAARDDAQLSLRALSEQVEISASTIGEYERGTKVPEADKLAKIAAALNHFTFRVDDYTFLIRPRDDDPKKLTADEQLDLDFAGEYTFARAHLKIESGRVSVAFDGLKARQLRPAVSQS